MTDDLLTPDEAALIVGVPAHQLIAWAWDRVGPTNVGTRVKPRYREEDLRAWLEKRAASPLCDEIAGVTRRHFGRD